MSLQEQLAQAKIGFTERVPEEAREAILRLVAEQQQSGVRYGVQEGEEAPRFRLADAAGASVSLEEELALGPVVLIFYRGGWCPFCNLQLRAYERLLPEFGRLGARLVAVSPQRPDYALAQQEKEALTFPVLSDPDGFVASRYRLLYELPAELQAVYVNTLKRDLAAYNGIDRWVLPIPATYVLDRSGIVRFASVNPDFMARAEPETVLDRLKAVADAN